MGVPRETLQMGRYAGQNPVSGFSHAWHHLTGMEMMVSLERASRMKWPQHTEEEPVDVLVRSDGEEGSVTDQRVPGGVKLPHLGFQMTDPLLNRLLAAGGSRRE